MGLEKQKATNTLALIAGLALIATGLILAFTDSLVIGVILLCVGVAVTVIAGTISNFFYTMDMMEYLNKKHKKP